MERPMLGLLDQRATLQWIQDYSLAFGADVENVSVWVSGFVLVHLLICRQHVRRSNFVRNKIQNTLGKPTDPHL
jgi:hypothetical protein